MLPQAVDAGEGLLLQEDGKAVLGNSLFNDLHDDQVLVDLDSVHPVLWGKLKLAGCNLTVPGLERDAHLEALMLGLLHALGPGCVWSEGPCSGCTAPGCTRGACP